MISKKFIFILSIFLIFISVVGAYAIEYQHTMDDFNQVVENESPDDLTGCCSVVYQLNGTDSLFSFRRDAGYTADIHIEEIDWHGKQAIKQYKTDGNYFCQVIITEDGWTIGFGGMDDGVDNERIENITAEMVVNNTTISESGLKEIQQIKELYGRGHALIKAPDGSYGVATAESTFTGQLKPGDYISVPNKDAYVRKGNFSLNTTDKVKAMTDLARSDAYGLTRRDITTYYFHSVDNSTFTGNATDIFASNDDGSLYEMETGVLYDNIYFNVTQINGSSLPMAPNYMNVGVVEFGQTNESTFGFFDLAIMFITIIILGIAGYIGIQYLKYLEYIKRYRR